MEIDAKKHAGTIICQYRRRKRQRRNLPISKVASYIWLMAVIFALFYESPSKTSFHANAFTTGVSKRSTHRCPLQTTHSSLTFSTKCWMWPKKIEKTAPDGDDPKSTNWEQMEQQVQASAQNTLDYNTLVKALTGSSRTQKDATSKDNKTIALLREGRTNGEDLMAELDALSQMEFQQQQPTSAWQIALSAATVSAGGTFWFVAPHNLYFTAAVFVVVFLLAWQDPVQDDSVAGALARLLGRQTLKSYQASIQPKLLALARAVVTGEEEVRQLRQQVEDLQQHNQVLNEWKQVRLTAEDRLPDYSLEELKDLSRQYKLPVGGTKLQVLVRLVEKGVIPMERDDDETR